MKIFIPFSVFILILFTSCKKTDDGSNCPPPTSIEISTNSPVVEGWPLTLSCTTAGGLLYKWTGANSWEMNYASYASDANIQTKLVTTLADGGNYKVQLRNASGCVEYEGNTIVKIIPAPLPPCTIVNNSSSSNTIGVGGVAYTSVIYFQGGGGIYTIQTSASGQSITFNFNGNTVPKPGIYKTSGYFAMDETTVGCYISASPYNFINNSGQDVYVNKINGKTQVSFCNASFSNPLGSFAIKVSAKLTEP